MTTHQRATSVVAGDGRTVDVLIMPWNTPARVTDDGRTFYTEEFAPGGLVPDSDRMFVRSFAPTDRPGRHTADLVGRIIATHNRADGLYGTLRVADTAVGRDVLAMLDPDVAIVEAISAEYDDDQPPPRPGGHVVRTNARLTGLAFTPFPQHIGSRVLAARSHGGTMPADDTDDQADDQADETTTADDSTTDDDVGTRAARSTTARPAQHQRAAPPHDDVGTRAARSTTARPAQHQRAAPPRPGVPAAGTGRFRSFGHYAIAAARGDLVDDELGRYQRALAGHDTPPHYSSHHRALVDLTTTAQTGVVHEQWLSEIVDLYRVLTPTVQAFSQRPLPDSGMTFQVPKITARGTGPTKQATQKTEVGSSPKTIGGVQFVVDTYGEGNDVSLQLILRSDPSFVDELMRLYTEGMAEKINTDAAAAVLAAADDTHPVQEYTTDVLFDGVVIDGAALILAALKRLPEVLLMSVNLWKALGKAKDTTGRPLYPGISPMNPVGSFTVTDTGGNIRSLDYVVEPAIPGGAGGIGGILGVRDAFRTYTGAIGTLTADVPSKLGRDYAVYEFAAMGALDTRGLVLIGNAA